MSRIEKSMLYDKPTRAILVSLVAIGLAIAGCSDASTPLAAGEGGTDSTQSYGVVCGEGGEGFDLMPGLAVLMFPTDAVVVLGEPLTSDAIVSTNDESRTVAIELSDFKILDAGTVSLADGSSLSKHASDSRIRFSISSDLFKIVESYPLDGADVLALNVTDAIIDGKPHVNLGLVEDVNGHVTALYPCADVVVQPELDGLLKVAPKTSRSSTIEQIVFELRSGFAAGSPAASPGPSPSPSPDPAIPGALDKDGSWRTLAFQLTADRSLSSFALCFSQSAGKGAGDFCANGDAAPKGLLGVRLQVDERKPLQIVLHELAEGTERELGAVLDELSLDLQTIAPVDGARDQASLDALATELVVTGDSLTVIQAD